MERIREMTERIRQHTLDAGEASPELAPLYTRAADIAWMLRAAMLRDNAIEIEVLQSDLAAAEQCLPKCVA